MAERYLPDEDQGRKFLRSAANVLFDEALDSGPSEKSQGAMGRLVAVFGADSLFCDCREGRHRGKYSRDGNRPNRSRNSRHYGYSSQSRYHHSTGREDECEWLLYARVPA